MTGQLLKTFMEPLGIDRIRTSQCTSTLDTRVYEYTAVLIKNGFLWVSNVRKFEIKVCLLQLTTEDLQCGNRTPHCSLQMEESGLERKHGEQGHLLCKHSNLSLYLQDPCTKLGMRHAHTGTCRPSTGEGMQSEGLPRFSDHQTSSNFSEKFCIKGIMWGRKTNYFLL